MSIIIRTLLISYLIIGAISCNNGEVPINENLTAVFTTEQIQQLEIIESKFQKYLESKLGCKNSNCYNEYLKHLYSFEKEGKLAIEIPNKLYEDIIDQLDNELLREIWINPNKLNSNYLYLNTKGKYIKFLKLLGESNKMVKKYTDNYLRTPDYSPSLVAGSIPEFINEDFKNKELRLFKAIHYISCGTKSK